MDADNTNQDIDFNMDSGVSTNVSTAIADIDMISSQFRTMNTNDKEHLVSEFRRLSNTDLSNEGCCFYLDMAEWNLNTALWAYYEYETSGGAGAGLNAALATTTSGTASNTLTTT